MRLSLSQDILQQMREGVIMLNSAGQVVGCNQAALPWVGACRARERSLKTLIANEAEGHVKLPLALELESSKDSEPAPPARAWVCKNGYQDYAIVVAPKAVAATPVVVSTPASAPDSAFLPLLGEEVRRQMTELRQLMHNQTPSDPRGERAIHQQCARVDKLLQSITDLSELLQRDKVFAEQRLSVAAIVADLVPTLKPTRGVRVQLQSGDGAQGVVYGHASWLAQALGTLLQNLMRSAPNQSHVEVAARQLGDFMVVTGHVVFGQGSGWDPAPGSANSITLPPSRSQTSAPNATSNAVGGDEDLSVQMLICRRIIQLHAGSLKLVPLSAAQGGGSDTDLIESFTLTFATGLPDQERSRVSCSHCPHTAQAQAYAADMAQLLAHH